MSHQERIQRKNTVVCPNCEGQHPLIHMCPICKGEGKVNLVNVPQWFLDLQKMDGNESGS